MARKPTNAEINRRLLDYPDAGNAAFIIGTGQGALEIATSSPVFGSFLIGSGLVAFLVSRIVMNDTLENHPELLSAEATRPTDRHKQRMNPLDYLRGISFSVLGYGFINELAALPDRTMPRVIAGIGAGCLGLVGVGVGEHLRPDMADGVEGEESSMLDTLQAAPDLLE